MRSHAFEVLTRTGFGERILVWCLMMNYLNIDVFGISAHQGMPLGFPCFTFIRVSQNLHFRMVSFVAILFLYYLGFVSAVRQWIKRNLLTVMFLCKSWSLTMVLLEVLKILWIMSMKKI